MSLQPKSVRLVLIGLCCIFYHLNFVCCICWFHQIISCFCLLCFPQCNLEYSASLRNYKGLQDSSSPSVLFKKHLFFQSLPNLSRWHRDIIPGVVMLISVVWSLSSLLFTSLRRWQYMFRHPSEPLEPHVRCVVHTHLHPGWLVSLPSHKAHFTVLTWAIWHPHLLQFMPSVNALAWLK